MARPKGGKNKTWRGRPIQTTEERFWSKVDKSGDCWLWTASAINDQGYGSFRFGDKMRSAHRVSWELAHGPIAVGEFVLHKCDNTKCVRPDHLFLGDQTDNMKDMAAKGRGVSTSPGAKLSQGDVSDVRLLLEQGVPITEIASKYKLTVQSIYNIRSGETW